MSFEATKRCLDGSRRNGQIKAAIFLQDYLQWRMDFSLSPEQEQIRQSVLKLCAELGEDYWLAKDRTADFPHEFHSALAKAGWLGIAMPTEHGGAGLGITEAAIMMQAIAESGAASTEASTLQNAGMPACFNLSDAA